MKRIFVVGCPRSGTTLVQGILAANSTLSSFPESHIFTDSCFDLKWRMYGSLLGRRRWFSAISGRAKNRLGIAAPSVQRRIPIFLERAQLLQEVSRFRGISNDMRAITNRFTTMLDENGGSHGWVEKTPNNVFCIPNIERYVDCPLFVHVIRDAPDNIASIVDASRKYRDWGKRYLSGADSLDRVIALWRRSTRTSLLYKDRSNHLIVRYREIINNPNGEIDRIARFVGVPYEKSMLEAKFSKLYTGEEEWKKGMGRGIKQPEKKWDYIFTPEEKKYIEDRVFQI